MKSGCSPEFRDALRALIPSFSNLSSIRDASNDGFMALKMPQAASLPHLASMPLTSGIYAA